MKLIYLIPVLILVSFVPAFASDSFVINGHINYTTGKDYNIQYDMINKRGIWTSAPERLYDYTDASGRNHYANYKLYQDTNIIRVESANAPGIVFDKATCRYDLYDVGIIGSSQPKIKNIGYTVKGKISTGTNWTAVNSVNNAVCNTMVEMDTDSIKITATKTAAVGSFEIILYHEAGKNLKVTLRAYNNNVSWNNHNIGFTETMEVPPIINFGKNRYDLSLYNQTSLDRNWIENNQSKMLTLGNKVSYDFGLGFENLSSVKIIWDGSTAKLAMNYLYPNGIVPYQQWIEVDPSFAASATNVYGIRTGAPAATTACPTTAASTIAGDIQLYMEPSGSVANYCQVVVPRFNVTSIPDNALVINANYTVPSGAPGNARPCDINEMTHDPTTSNPTTLWNDALNTANGTTFINNNTYCQGTDTVNFAANATSDIQSTITSGNDIVSFGLVFDSMTRDAVYHEVQFNPVASHVLSIRYNAPTGPPNAPTNFACTPVARHLDCTWTASAPKTGNQTNFVSTYYMGLSLNNSTFPMQNKTSTGNVTTFSNYKYTTPNTSYFANLTAAITGYGNSTSASHIQFTTDNIPTTPTNILTTSMSISRNKINWAPPASDGNDPITGYHIEFCTTCTSWTVLVNQTGTPSVLNYNHTGISGGSGTSVKYRMGAWNGVGLSAFSANFTQSTQQATTGTGTLGTGIIGDVIQVNATISITAASPSPVTVSSIRLYVNGTLSQTQATSESIAMGSSHTFDPFWYRFPDGTAKLFRVDAVTSSVNSTTVTISTSNATDTREYDPGYSPAIENPAVQGDMNYTIARFDNEDGVLLHVNRIGVSTGTTWQIECISQTNSEAAQTKNETLSWAGTWRNTTGTGYFNTTWTGVSNTHTYITCFNEDKLFTTTSYTNSSLALFGIQLFDDSYGSMLGVPVGIFFLAMAGSMASKRTAPTWIVVVLGMAGTMATIGFFTLDPLIWGLALVSGMLGLFVNQKVF